MNLKQNDQLVSSIKQPQPFYAQWISPKSSLKGSQSSDLIEKVPKEMRSSLKKQKSIKQTIVFDNFYQGIKNLLDSESLNCSICLDTLRNPTSITSCNHKFCSQCVITYLTFKINSMQEIFCPNEQCNLKIDFDSNGWKSLPQEYKVKYTKQQLWRQTIRNPDLKLCPSQKCEQGTINLRKIPLTCQKCRSVFCRECMMAAHPGKQCEQNFRENFKEWKRCSKCQIFIQKLQGCNHMVCRCNNEFCFVCLEPWTSQHYSCVEDKVSQFISGNDICCPKIFAFLMVILFPILIILAIASLPIFGVVVILGGLFFSFYLLITTMSRQNWCMSLFLVFICPIGLSIVIIGLLIWALFSYYIPVIRQYLGIYLRNIRNLWNGT